MTPNSLSAHNRLGGLLACGLRYLRVHWRLAHDEAADPAPELFARLVDKDLLARF